MMRSAIQSNSESVASTSFIRSSPPLVLPRHGARPKQRVEVRSSSSDAMPSSAGAADAGKVATPQQKRQLSLRQQWRGVQGQVAGAAAAVRAALLAFPLVAAAVSAYAKVAASLEPFIIAASQQIEKVYEGYCEFCSEEVKRAWRFKRQHEPEDVFWAHLVKFTNMLLLTLLYECAVPVSLFWALAVPTYLNWILYDDFWKPWKSPISMGILLIAPLKFVPWAEFMLF